MFIDGPSFMHRKNLNSHNQASNQEEGGFRFGTERNHLIQYVTSALSQHAQDELILQRFRRDAEERKHRRFDHKKQPQHHYRHLTDNLPPLLPHNLSALSQEHHPRDLSAHKNNYEQIQPKPEKEPLQSKPEKEPLQSKHERELQSVVQHQHGLAERYRKLLEVKQKQLKHKSKKLQRHKQALQRMSQKVRHLEKEQYLARKEEQLDLSHMQVALKQLNSQLMHNKSSLEQLSSVRGQFKAGSQAVVLSDCSVLKSQESAREQEQFLRRPGRNQLQLIKRKAKSMKHQKGYEQSPGLICSNIPTEESNEIDSPRNNAHSNSIVKMAGLGHLA